VITGEQECVFHLGELYVCETVLGKTSVNFFSELSSCVTEAKVSVGRTEQSVLSCTGGNLAEYWYTGMSIGTVSHTFKREFSSSLTVFWPIKSPGLTPNVPVLLSVKFRVSNIAEVLV